jgi:hypothetical protein
MTGPPDTTEYSMGPQLLHPVTRVKIKSAQMYAKPPYRDHETVNLLADLRSCSFCAETLAILAAKAERVFSNDSAELSTWRVVSGCCIDGEAAYPPWPEGHHAGRLLRDGNSEESPTAVLNRETFKCLSTQDQDGILDERRWMTTTRDTINKSANQTRGFCPARRADAREQCVCPCRLRNDTGCLDLPPAVPCLDVRR